MLIEPTAPGWKPSPNSPTAAGCVCTSPSPWLLAQTARAHDLAAGQAKPSSSSGSTERLPGDFIDAPLPQLRAEAGCAARPACNGRDAARDHARSPPKRSRGGPHEQVDLRLPA